MFDRGFNSKDAEHWHDDHRESDADVPIDHDGRSPARTGFYPEGGDYNDESLDNVEKWKRLDQLNHGQLHDSDYPPRRRDAETLRDLDIVASRFEITEHQKERCEHIISSIDDIGETWPWDRIVVVFALVTLVVNEDNRHVQTESMYGDFIEDMGVNRKSVHKVRDDLRDYL